MSEVTHPRDAKELRLALVLYGGVSLAIYMHGTTKEIHRLVAASALLEAGVAEGGSPSERVYRELLARLAEEHHESLRTRVVVDIVAGTSAGGINGIYLAKALAHNRSQDTLRELWLDRGDIKKLVRGPQWLPLWLKVPWLLATASRRAPLRGDAMSVWLFDALADMDADPGTPGVASLMPADHPLQLFVTVTDFYGYNRELPTDDPAPLYDRRHRHVLEFASGPDGIDGLGPAHNGALAFAARTTSCFPGAFPPVTFSGFAGYLRDRNAGLETLGAHFRLYELAKASAADTAFVDGGVLDNRPFGHAIGAIRERPASVEVDRRLLYLEPDPGRPKALPEGRSPGTIASVLGAVSGIPRREPILDELLEVARLNERVRRIRDVIEVSFEPVAGRIEGILGDSLAELPSDPESERFERWREQINAAAATDAGYPSYLRMKISGVVDRYAKTVCAVSRYPGDSSQAFAVRGVLRSWAEETGLFEKATPPTKEQTDFLRALDLEYGVRRLRFVVAGLSWWYRYVGRPGFPERPDLDAGRARLYAAISRLERAMRGRGFGQGLLDAIARTFGVEPIAQGVAQFGRDWKRIVEYRLGELDALALHLRGYHEAELDGFSAELFRDLDALTTSWDPARRRDLLVRYLGFPLWDALLFPLQSLSDTAECDRVEVVRMSPLDATLLLPPDGGPKLKGVRLHHFGAFFARPDRENDYLWGRLDGAERLVRLLLGRDHPSYEHWCGRAFAAVLDEEAESLQLVRPLIVDIRSRCEALTAAGASGSVSREAAERRPSPARV